jgi:ribosomal protein S2
MKLNYQLFFSLGIHIGNYKFNLKHYYKSFLIGYINHFCIFDLSKILFFFKKALFFFIFLGKSNGKFLFYNHDFSNLGKFFQFFFYN